VLSFPAYKQQAKTLPVLKKNDFYHGEKRGGVKNVAVKRRRYKRQGSNATGKKARADEREKKS